MLVFGMLSGGLLFYHYISLTQAARDSARFASTYPITDTTKFRDCAMGVALSEAGFNVSPASPCAGWSPASAALTDHGYACVSFVAPAVGGNPAAVYTEAVGTAPSGSAGYPAAGYSGSPCLTAARDSRTDVRVQVVISRNQNIFIGVSNLTLTTGTKSVIPYERQYP